MKIGYLVSRYPAVSHTFILREVRGLRALGLDIAVASINEPDRERDRLDAEEREESDRALYVKRRGAFGALVDVAAVALRSPLRTLAALAYALRLGGTDVKRCAYGLFYFVEAAVLSRWMRREGLAHLHVHFATPASTVGLILTRLAAVGLSITVHGPDEFYDAPGYRLAEKMEGAAFVCCIGQYARSQLMKLSEPSLWDKLEVTPLGVDPAVFAPRTLRGARGPFEVLCVGRLVPAKGQHVLLQAIARLAANGRDARLTLAGDGPDRASLEREAAELGIADRVVFAGAVNPDCIRTLYEKADAFALASFAEGIPVVLMEAMSMEIPCVTTFITGIPELIRTGIDGLLVAPSDTDGLAAALASLMDDGALSRRLGQAGRLRVVQRYDLARNTQRLADVFRRRLAA